MEGNEADLYINPEDLIDTDLRELLDELKEVGGFTQEEIYKLENIRARFEKKLEAIGINLKVLKDKEGFFDIEFDIEDSYKFLSFLDRIKENGFDENKIEFLDEILMSLEYQLSQHYNIEDSDDDYMINLLSNLDRIIDDLIEIQLKNKYEKHNLSYIIERLEGLNKARKLKYIYLYQEVMKEELLANPSSSYSWSLDLLNEKITIQEYQGNWNHTLSIIEKIKENPNADDFRREVIEHLLNNIENVFRELEEFRKHKGKDDLIKELEKKLDEVSKRLEELK